jgi:hypothetical protein
MGEKPSPSGEDFSSSMGLKQYTLPLVPPVKGGEVLRLLLPSWEIDRSEMHSRAGVKGILYYFSPANSGTLQGEPLQGEPKATAFRR